MRHPAIAHIDMDAFFAAIEQRDHPDWQGKPVVVGADPKGGQGRGVVSTCSYEARRFGIHSAMPISIAFQRCPQAIYVPVDMKKYADVSRSVFDVFYQFTPDLEPISIDEAFLDLTPICHLHGSALTAAEKIKKSIKGQIGLSASIGIAPIKMLAKIASDYCKPDGLLEIGPEAINEFLDPLPIEKLWGVGPKTRDILNNIGITTIGQAAKTPKEKLFHLFGESGLHLWDLANGIDPRPVLQDGEIKSVSNEYTFEHDTADEGVIARQLLMLCEKVSRRLRVQELKGKTISIKIRLSGFKTYTRAHTFTKRTNFVDDLYRISQKLIEEFIKRKEGVRLVGVRVSNFSDPYVQDSLFDDAQDKKEDLHLAVDLIKDKFGEGAIRRGN